MTTAKTPGKAKKGEEREILYSKRESEIRDGDKALTADDAKELLGWEVIVAPKGTGVKEIEKRIGEKVRLTRNTKNRPIRWSHVEELVQEFLHGRWKFHSTGIGVGKTGELMQGQHRLLALILADWEWEKGENKERYQELSKGVRPSMECVLITGMDEDDATFAALNREMVASFADTLFRSVTWPKKLGDKDNAKTLGVSDKRYLAKMLDHATKFLWGRTGAKIDPFTPTRTNAEALDFYLNHKKLMECCTFIYQADEAPDGPDGEKMPRPIAQYVPPGFAAALLYLMGCSSSDGAEYRKVNTIADRSERKLKWENLDKAKEFWSLFGRMAGDMEGLRQALVNVQNSKDGATTGAKIAVVVNAWNEWTEGNKLEAKKLKPDYNKKDQLIQPSIGGIDTAGMTKKEILGSEEKEGEEETPPGDDTPKTPSMAEQHRARKTGKKAAEVAANGEAVDEDETPPGEGETIEVGYAEDETPPG